MAIEVAKIVLKTVQDASGVKERIKAGQFTADQVIAVIGKTEGNGGVNDFTRILADQAFRKLLLKRGTRSEAEIHNIPMVWSGGCDGVITPHATVFARNGKSDPADKARLMIGTALSAELFPEDIGRNSARLRARSLRPAAAIPDPGNSACRRLRVRTAAAPGGPASGDKVGRLLGDVAIRHMRERDPRNLFEIDTGKTL